MKFGKPAPLQLVHWTIAERFGWTLEYIDRLPYGRIMEWFQIEDGRKKAAPAPPARRRGRR